MMTDDLQHLPERRPHAVIVLIGDDPMPRIADVPQLRAKCRFVARLGESWRGPVARDSSALSRKLLFIGKKASVIRSINLHAGTQAQIHWRSVMVNAPHGDAKKPDRPSHEARVAQIAGELIAEHGSNAVYAAIARLNDAIDRNDRISRDFYAEIVCAIIEQDRGTSVF
jgi:hypothetical protein